MKKIPLSRLWCRTLIAAASLFVSSAAQASHYEVTFSGDGKFTVKSMGSTWTAAGSVTGNTYSASTSTNSPTPPTAPPLYAMMQGAMTDLSSDFSSFQVPTPPGGQTPAVGPPVTATRSVTWSGPVKIKVEWVKDEGETTLKAPPEACVIELQVLSSATGNTKSASNGYTDANSSTSQYTDKRVGTHFLKMTNTSSQTITWSPTSSASLENNSWTPGAASGEVSVKVVPHPLDLTISGVLESTDESTGDKSRSALIGQIVKGSISDSGLLDTNGSVVWSIGGTPYSSYNPKTEKADAPTGWISTRTEETQFFVAEAGSVDVSVTFSVTADDLSVNLHKPVKVIAPGFSFSYLVNDKAELTSDRIRLSGTISVFNQLSIQLTGEVKTVDGFSNGNWGVAQLISKYEATCYRGAPWLPARVNWVLGNGNDPLPFDIAAFPPLDGSFTYLSNFFGNGMHEAWQGRADELGMADRPDCFYYPYSKSVALSVSFRNHILYRPPSNGIGTAWVPLAYGTWDLNLDATDPVAGGQANGGATNSGISTSHVFPVWKQTTTGGVVKP